MPRASQLRRSAISWRTLSSSWCECVLLLSPSYARLLAPVLDSAFTSVLLTVVSMLAEGSVILDRPVIAHRRPLARSSSPQRYRRARYPASSPPPSGRCTRSHINNAGDSPSPPVQIPSPAFPALPPFLLLFFLFPTLRSLVPTTRLSRSRRDRNSRANLTQKPARVDGSRDATVDNKRWT